MPRWFFLVIIEVLEGLKRVPSYLSDVNVFDLDLAAEFGNNKGLFHRLPKDNLDTVPAKVYFGATIWRHRRRFFRNTISPPGIRPHAKKAAAITNAYVQERETPTLSPCRVHIHSCKALVFFCTPTRETVASPLVDDLATPPF